MEYHSFSEEIATNKSIEHLDNPAISGISTERASVVVRERGCYVAEAALYSPSLHEVVDVLYSDPDLSTPKLTASHIMTPVGPYEGIGGRHGFPRWADYKVFTLEDGPDGEKGVAYQAKRLDTGLALAKLFELSDSSLSTITSLHNPGDKPENTSLGEHLYFSLEGGQISGLRVDDGLEIDDLLGEGAEASIKKGEPIYWDNFAGNITVVMPAGHTIKLAVDVNGAPREQLGMLVWHRPGSSSICFEPTLGFDPETAGTGLTIEPYETVELLTKIELL